MMSRMSCGWNLAPPKVSVPVVYSYVISFYFSSYVVTLAGTYPRALKSFINELELVGGTKLIYSLTYMI